MGCSTCGGKRKYQGVTSVNVNSQQGQAIQSAAAAIANAGGDPEESLVAVSTDADDEKRD